MMSPKRASATTKSCPSRYRDPELLGLFSKGEMSSSIARSLLRGDTSRTSILFTADVKKVILHLTLLVRSALPQSPIQAKVLIVAFLLGMKP